MSRSFRNLVSKSMARTPVAAGASTTTAPGTAAIRPSTRIIATHSRMRRPSTETIPTPSKTFSRRGRTEAAICGQATRQERRSTTARRKAWIIRRFPGRAATCRQDDFKTFIVEAKGSIGEVAGSDPARATKNPVLALTSKMSVWNFFVFLS